MASATYRKQSGGDEHISSDDEEASPDLTGLNDHHDASGPSTVTTAALDANDITSRACSFN